VGLQAGFNLWIKRGEQVVLSLWRVRLLQAVERTGSISAAAEALNVPYRRAWERLRESEERLGFQLVEGQVGGSGGGGAVLTEAGREYVARFERFSEGLEALVEERFAAAFGDLN
jgi:molybdate transport system regulatory protein